MAIRTDTAEASEGGKLDNSGAPEVGFDLQLDAIEDRLSISSGSARHTIGYA